MSMIVSAQGTFPPRRPPVQKSGGDLDTALERVGW